MQCLWRYLIEFGTFYIDVWASELGEGEGEGEGWFDVTQTRTRKANLERHTPYTGVDTLQHRKEKSLGTTQRESVAN